MTILIHFISLLDILLLYCSIIKNLNYFIMTNLIQYKIKLRLKLISKLDNIIMNQRYKILEENIKLPYSKRIKHYLTKI